MADKKKLVLVDELKLRGLIAGVMPFPEMQETVYKELTDLPPGEYEVPNPPYQKPKMPGVTPQRAARGEGIVKTAIRLSKLTGHDFDETLEALITTTDIWDQRIKLRGELLGYLRQVQTFLSERITEMGDSKDLVTIQELARTYTRVSWRISDLEEIIAKEADSYQALKDQLKK